MKHRLLRVNEVLKRELSGLIAREMNFEQGLVSVNQVDITSDLKNARLCQRPWDDGRKRDQSARGASRRLQSALAKHVSLEIHPHLVFHSMSSIERGTCHRNHAGDRFGPRK